MFGCHKHRPLPDRRMQSNLTRGGVGVLLEPSFHARLGR